MIFHKLNTQLHQFINFMSTSLFSKMNKLDYIYICMILILPYIWLST